MLIDSHCHLDDYEDLPAILANAHAAGVDTLLAIGIGNGPADIHRALDIANTFTSADGSFPAVFASAGIHPQEAHQATEENLSKLVALMRQPRCIAVGEIGLDYYHVENPDVATQQRAFVAQMKIAETAGKPILIHCRTSELATPAAKEKFGTADAWADLLFLIGKHWTGNKLPGIMHCFSGNEVQAEASLAAGFYLSFAGNLTYPKSTIIQSVAASAPANRILVETDAPFLTPIPLRGQPNEPANTALTAKFLAALRNTTSEAIATQTTTNFHTLFPCTLHETSLP
jgi:TatD DNase family protein